MIDKKHGITLGFVFFGLSVPFFYFGLGVYFLMPHIGGWLSIVGIVLSFALLSAGVLCFCLINQHQDVGVQITVCIFLFICLFPVMAGISLYATTTTTFKTLLLQHYSESSDAVDITRYYQLPANFAGYYCRQDDYDFNCFGVVEGDFYNATDDFIPGDHDANIFVVFQRRGKTFLVTDTDKTKTSLSDFVKENVQEGADILIEAMKKKARQLQEKQSDQEQKQRDLQSWK